MCVIEHRLIAGDSRHGHYRLVVAANQDAES